MERKASSREADHVHLVDRQQDVLDSEQRRDMAVTPRLREDTLASVDENDGELGGRCAGGHVPRVLLVTWGVGNDIFSRFGRKETIGDVDRDALLALRCRDRRRATPDRVLLTDGAEPLRIDLERGELILEDHLQLVQQPADQRALAVVHRSRRS